MDLARFLQAALENGASAARVLPKSGSARCSKLLAKAAVPTGVWWPHGPPWAGKLWDGPNGQRILCMKGISMYDNVI